MEPKIIDLECPSCGAPLQAQNDTIYTCPFCQHKVKVQEVRPIIHQTVSHSPHEIAMPKRVFWLAFGLFILSFVLIISGVSMGSGGSAGSTAANVQAVRGDTDQPSQLLNPTPEEIREIPESKPMQQFLAAALAKDFELVTTQDLAAFRYLNIDYIADENDPYYNQNQKWVISYSFAEYNPFTCEGEEYVKTFRYTGPSDIEAWEAACFTGLTCIGGELSKMKKSGELAFTAMPHLEFAMFTSFDEPLNAALYANPAALRGIQLDMHSQDPQGLAQFTGLTHLSIACADGYTDFSTLAGATGITHLFITAQLADISWISQHTGLTSLEINGSKVTDYTVLYGLPKLESLALQDAASLRDIGFTASMPNLQTLTIEGSLLISLEPLENKTSLQTLNLYSNSYLRDFAPVASLANLKSFYADYVTYAKNMDLNSLAHLETVQLHAKHLQAVTGNPYVKDLTVMVEDYMETLDVFWDMQGLESLRFTGKNQYSEGLESLAVLPNLKHLYMSEFFIVRGFTPFAYPGLETLYLYDCILPLDMGMPPGDTSLTSLTFAGCRHYDLDWNRQEYPNNRQEILAACTALEELTLIVSSLDSIAFAENLAELRYLDITDNYVSDLGPLAGLTKLETLICPKNNINTYDMLPEGVAVTS